MNTFQQLNITPPVTVYNGKKVEIEDILNTEIVVCDFRIEPSKYPKKPGDRCMHMQVKVEGTERVIFTIAKRLMATMDLADKTKLPFTTKIIKQDKRYEFS